MASSISSHSPAVLVLKASDAHSGSNAKPEAEMIWLTSHDQPSLTVIWRVSILHAFYSIQYPKWLLHFHYFRDYINDYWKQSSSGVINLMVYFMNSLPLIIETRLSMSKQSTWSSPDLHLQSRLVSWHSCALHSRLSAPLLSLISPPLQSLYLVHYQIYGFSFLNLSESFFSSLSS